MNPIPDAPTASFVTDQWLSDHPVSDLLTEIEKLTQALEVHAQEAIRRGGIKRGYLLEVLAVQIRVRIHMFTAEVERSIDEDE